MNEHKEKTYETYDITPTLVLLFFIVITFVCITHQVDISHIRFEYKIFKHETLKGWKELMFRTHPYDYNSKMARSTDVCASSIRHICNKK